MITISIEGEAEAWLKAAAAKKGISVDNLVSEVINKFLPVLHTIDKERMAEGYADMGEINVNISEGISD